MDYYEILGVAREATPGAIKTAWRKASRATHPDHGGDAERFKLVQEAYQVLSDPARRASYDATGRDEHAELVRGALEVFTGLVADVLDSGGATPEGLLAALAYRLGRARGDLVETERMAERRLESARAFRGRTAGRDGQPSLIERIVAKKIADAEENLADVRRAIRLNRMALDLVNDHELVAAAGTMLGHEPAKLPA